LSGSRAGGSQFQSVGAPFNQYAAIGFSVLAAALFPFARRWTTAVFYVWAGAGGDALPPLALAIDVWDSRQGEQRFPFLGGCGWSAVWSAAPMPVGDAIVGRDG